MSFGQIAAHKRVWEYDGAYKCLDCKAQWGELTGSPTMPEKCSPKEQSLAEEARKHLLSLCARNCDVRGKAYVEFICAEVERLTAVGKLAYEECAKVCEDQIVPSYQAGGDAIEAANYAFRAAAGAIRALAPLPESQQPRSGDLAAPAQSIDDAEFGMSEHRERGAIRVKPPRREG